MDKILRDAKVNEINVWHDNLGLTPDWVNFMQNWLNNRSSY